MSENNSGASQGLLPGGVSDASPPNNQGMSGNSGAPQGSLPGVSDADSPNNQGMSGNNSGAPLGLLPGGVSDTHPPNNQGMSENNSGAPQSSLPGEVSDPDPPENPPETVVTEKQLIAQNEAINRVYRCELDDHYGILGVSPDCTIDQVFNASEDICAIVGVATDKDANDVCDMVRNAANIIAGELNEMQLDTPLNEVKANEEVQNTEPGNEDSYQQGLSSTYDSATQFIHRLRLNPKDTDARDNLQNLNAVIKQGNQSFKKSENIGIIDYLFYIQNFELALQYQHDIHGGQNGQQQDIRTSSSCMIATNAYPTLRSKIAQFNTQHGYPESWNINDKWDTAEQEWNAANQSYGPKVKTEPSQGIKLGGIPKFEGQEEDDGEDDGEDDVALFVKKEVEKRPGQDNGTIVCWKPTLGSEEVIIRHGPRNSRIFRLENINNTSMVLDKEKVPEMLPQRLGEKKDDNNRRLYKRCHFKEIRGVALINNVVGEALDEVKLKEPNEKRRYKPIQIRVRWEIPDAYGVPQSHYSFETRTTVRHYISSNEALGDEAIYLAALEQENRYEAYLNNAREEYDRTPSVDPGSRLAEIMRNRSKSPQVNLTSESTPKAHGVASKNLALPASTAIPRAEEYVSLEKQIKDLRDLVMTLVAQKSNQ